MRQVLFISHANPQDNEFTLWLSSRLKLLDYYVWCDIKELLGGEKQWEVIDDIIRNKAAKFLFVVSKDICVKPGILKDGISKEFSLAESLAKKLESDFIIPLKIDKDSSYDSFIGQNRYNHIKFDENWATGFTQLVDKLEKDGVKKENNRQARENPWYVEHFIDKFKLTKKQEHYLMNWWEIGSLPESFEIYQYEYEDQAKLVENANRFAAVVRHGNTVASLGYAETNITEKTPVGDSTINYLDYYTIKTEDILNKTYVSDTFPKLSDCQSILKRLLKRSFHLTMRSKGLWWYELSSHRQCYYYPSHIGKKVNYIVNGKKRTKSLLGNFKINNDKNAYWHFGVIVSVALYPQPYFVLKSHILFSDDGNNIWSDKDMLHRARRKKGKRWFNEEWRDLLVAFITSLQGESEEVRLFIDPGLSIKMISNLSRIESDMGYIDPENPNRQAILSEDEQFDDIEKIVEGEEENIGEV